MALWVVRTGKYGQREQIELDENIVAIGWSDLPDLSEITTKEDLENKYLKYFEEGKKMALATNIGQIWRFINEIQINDLVAVPLKSQSSILMGKVLSDYEYTEKYGNDCMHIRRVKWLKNLPRTAFGQDILSSFSAQMTVYQVKRNDAEDRIKKMLSQELEIKAEIDEEKNEIELYAREQINNIIEKFNQHINGVELESLIFSFLEVINNISEEKLEITREYRLKQFNYDIFIYSQYTHTIIEVFLPNWYSFEVMQRELHNKIEQLKYRGLSENIQGIILTNFQDWYLIDLRKFVIIEYFNYRNFRNFENLKKLKELLTHNWRETLFSFYSSEYYDNIFTRLIFNPIDSIDLINLLIQDNSYESTNVDNKSCKVSFPLDLHQFAFILAEVRNEENTEIAFKYKVEGNIARGVKGKKYKIPKCDKPSCRRLFGLIKTKLESMVGVPGGYCCPKCYKKFFVIDPETREKIIEFDVN